jgi:hypothetical protein
MKKPAWVSFMGWAFIACVCVWLSGVVFTWHTQPWDLTKGIVATAMLAAVPAFVLWLLGSIVHAVRKAGQKQQVASLAQLMNAAKQGAGLCGFPGPGGVACDLPSGHQGAHRGTSAGPRAVMTSPLGLTGTEPRR